MTFKGVWLHPERFRDPSKDSGEKDSQEKKIHQNSVEPRSSHIFLVSIINNVDLYLFMYLYREMKAFEWTYQLLIRDSYFISFQQCLSPMVFVTKVLCYMVMQTASQKHSTPPQCCHHCFLKNHLVHNFLWKICSDVHPKLAQNLDFYELKFHPNSLQLFTHLKHWNVTAGTAY